MQKALVTGAGGYLASRLARILAEDGVQVRALFRSKSNADLVHPNIELVNGDLTDVEKLPEIIQGCTHVFHTAAFASNWAKDPSIFYKMNVEMAVNLFDACFENGVQRVVFTSSAGVIGPSDDGILVTENHQRKTRFFGDYEKSKFEAEQKVKSLVAEKGFDIVMANPTRIYGPGVRGKSNSVTEIIERYINRKWKIRLGSGQEIANYGFVDDVARGHILAMQNGRKGERYILGGDNVSFDGFIQIISEASGVKNKLFTVPFAVLAGYTKIESLFPYVGLNPMLTYDWVEKLQNNWGADLTKAKTELGYSPRSLQQGVEETINWLRKNG